MNLPKNAEYDDLSGLEAKEILAARFWQFMEQIPEFQQRFALTRVKMRLEISLDIWGATPPRKIVHDELEMTASEPIPGNFTRTVTEISATAEVDAFNNPPDQVREDHGLPLPRSARGQSGFMETVPVLLDGVKPKVPPAPKPEQLPHPPAPILASTLPGNQPNPTQKKIGRRRYAGWVEQDKGAAVTGERDESPVVGDEKFVSTIMSAPRGNVVMPQADFLDADHRVNKSISHEHVAERIQQSAALLNEAERQFNSAPDTSNVEWNGGGDGKS